MICRSMHHERETARELDCAFAAQLSQIDHILVPGGIFWVHRFNRLVEFERCRKWTISSVRQARRRAKDEFLARNAIQQARHLTSPGDGASEFIVQLWAEEPARIEKNA